MNEGGKEEDEAQGHQPPGLVRENVPPNSNVLKTVLSAIPYAKKRNMKSFACQGTSLKKKRRRAKTSQFGIPKRGKKIKRAKNRTGNAYVRNRELQGAANDDESKDHTGYYPDDAFSDMSGSESESEELSLPLDDPGYQADLETTTRFGSWWAKK